MKKPVSIVLTLLGLILPSMVSAAGVCTQSLSHVPDSVLENSPLKVLTFSCVADASDGSYPSTATSDTITGAIKGFYVTEARTSPGLPAPTTLYDIVLNDAAAIDLMGGTLANRSATLPERAIPMLASGIYGATAVDGAVTLVITNNVVQSAATTVKVFLSR